MRLDLLNETITSFGSSTFRETSPTGSPTTADLTPPAESAPTSVDLAAFAPTVERAAPVTVASSANLAPSDPAPQTPAQPAVPKKKKSMLPLVIGIVVILLLLVGGGAAAAGYFLWLKPRMEANRRPVVTVGENENSNTSTGPSNTNSADNANANANTNTNGNANDTAKKEPEPFVPTAGTVQFANSKANLDGKLLEHYVDFSFYYPKSWLKDPKAGVAGASNFARLSDSGEQYAGENVAVSWYTSNGTFELDNAIFHDRAKALSDQFAKSLPNYQEVSQGDTSVNTMKGYEFRFKGVFKDTPKGDLPYWGRVVFLPSGNASEKNGVTIIMLATSLAPEVAGPDDVGVKGGLPLILESFRFGGGG